MRMGRDAHEQVGELFKIVRLVETREVGLATLSGWLVQINALCGEMLAIAVTINNEYHKGD